MTTPDTQHCSGPLLPAGDGWYTCPACGLRYHLPSSTLEVAEEEGESDPRMDVFDAWLAERYGDAN